MLTAIAAIFVFLFVILFHEFGHFVVAKSVGIRVNEFSIGMGPKLYQRKKGETEYTIRALPIGGYVSMEGEDEDSDDPRGMANVSPWARMAVMAAGAIMNFILAIIVFSIVSFYVGTPTNIVGETLPGSPAEKIGMVEGDRINAIDGSKVKSWNDVIENISQRKVGEEIELRVENVNKEGIEKTLILKTEESDDGRAVIGIVPYSERGFFKSIKGGFVQTGTMIKSMFTVFGMLITGQLGRGQLSGPIGVINAIGQAAKSGFINVLYFMGFISVNLGFFNLLPIPALDGSRILFTLVEIIRGKPLDPEVEGRIHFVGFVLLISLMLFVSYSDVVNIFKR